MAQSQPEEAEREAQADVRSGLWPKRWRWRVSLILLALIILTFAVAWYQREQIAGDLIDDTLAAYDLDASYEIESIGTRQQIIRNLVIGDAATPDFTAERVSLDINYTLGPPQIGRIELTNPRLYGAYKEGVFSLGALDSALFTESAEPAGLPALDVAIRDGRALIESDFGAVGIKLDGEGRLDDGFAGKLAVTAPSIGDGDCALDEATAYGDVRSESGRLTFEGPIRLRGVGCAGTRLASLDAGAVLTLSDDLGAVEGEFDLRTGELAFEQMMAESVEGRIDGAWRFAEGDGAPAEEIKARHALTASDLKTDYGALETVGFEGGFNSVDGLSRSELTSSITAQGLDSGLVNAFALDDARDAASGTLFESLLEKLEKGLGQALQGGDLAGEATVRINDGVINAIIPEARLRSGGGDTVLALSRQAFRQFPHGWNRYSRDSGADGASRRW